MGYDFYFRHFLFWGINLQGKRLIDVGGGNGIASFWAVSEGEAMEALILEPQVEGSNPKMEAQFSEMDSRFALTGKISLVKGRIADLDVNPARRAYDVALLHNMINHIDESAVAAVTSDPSARRVFVDFASELRNSLAAHAPVIIVDCSSRNLWGDLHVPNPVAPGIDWRIHQPPAVWRAIFEEAGYGFGGLSWFSRREFGRMGKKLLGNRFGSYCTTSVFRLIMI